MTGAPQASASAAAPAEERQLVGPGVVVEELREATPVHERLEEGVRRLGREPLGEHVADLVAARRGVLAPGEVADDGDERPEAEELAAEEERLLPRGGGDEGAAGVRQEDAVLRRVDEIEELGRLHDRDRPAEVPLGQRVDVEEVHLAAVVREDLEEAEHLSDRGGRERDERADRGATGQGGRRPPPPPGGGRP